MFVKKTTSLADQVFDRLEQDILSGVYPRDSLLTELQLCDDLGVSRTPIREALRRLEQEHLIETTGRGMRVLSITPEDVEAIFEIRIKVEQLAAECCATRITAEEIAHMREILDLQEFYVEKENPEQQKMLDEEFHKAIYEACGTTIYHDTLMPLMAKLRKVRGTSLENTDRAHQSCNEHRAILKALENGKEKAAGEAMFIHLSNARNYAQSGKQ